MIFDYNNSVLLSIQSWFSIKFISIKICTMVEKLENKEKLSDKEKLKQVQNFVKDMNDLWFKAWDQKIAKWTTKLETQSLRWDWSSFIRISLTKNWKELFKYDMNASMFHKENWKERPVWVTMKVDWKILSYSWDENNEHWIYNNYELLDKASQYKKEIKSMLKSKEIAENVSEFKNELSSLQSGIETPDLA